MEVDRHLYSSIIGSTFRTASCFYAISLYCFLRRDKRSHRVSLVMSRTERTKREKDANFPILTHQPFGQTSDSLTFPAQPHFPQTSERTRAHPCHFLPTKKKLSNCYVKETKEITLPPRLELGTSRLTVERASQLRHGRDMVCVSELMGFDGSTAEGVGI